MYTADAGKAGLGLTDGRMMVPRGRMLGGSSGINYMAYVRGQSVSFSLLQTSTRDGKRSSTYHAFLEGEAEERPNLEVICGAQVTRVLFETVGSPQILLLSGIGPCAELEAVGVDCRLDSPHVGKHLKDHLEVSLMFPAPDVGVSMTDVAISMGPDALRAPAGPLPADPADDDAMPDELKALKAEAERQVTEWATTGIGLASSSLYEACAWFSTGLGDDHTHDAQIGFYPCAFTGEILKTVFRVDPDELFDDASAKLTPDAKWIIVLANPVQPHSEGEIVLASADPTVHPDIRMNYFGDPHDMNVMIAVIRRALDVVANWPGDQGIGALELPPALAAKHYYQVGDTPGDALLEDYALHYALTVYHPTSTCAMGKVVDDRLRVEGVSHVRVADASVMPNVISGNTNAPSIMIGEKAAEMIARDHNVALKDFVGTH